ncbi:DUF2141 domain-containing protein [Stutzerimonas stutzeri]|uniref:DUF2141 domain-containing protein n=1 Tax=Stutzerimonas stutzeri TaxID=316 RepID=UPI002108F606|nr:DUF2141 domain-containing protein [Stutzerimonas stutzeri]MCQ4259815.1 DUF2141 domain-containing protein [Stutzerimonas stutzeri]
MTLRAVLALAAAITTSGFAVAEGESMTVRLNGVEHDRGTVRVALFSDPKTFRKADQAYAGKEVPASAGTVTVEFEEVPAGQYAVMAYHDENGNGELDLRFGMMPIEGYGLSNNPKVMGPPSFKDSQFEVPGDKPSEIDIDIRY